MSQTETSTEEMLGDKTRIPVGTYWCQNEMKYLDGSELLWVKNTTFARNLYYLWRRLILKTPPQRDLGGWKCPKCYWSPYPTKKTK
ncbi:MAG TPA: hypothetical protein P5274_01735 [Candidatus Paceibacterota bacterium]|nr:hypothetical protein [Candidatus Paceibacterota bacterium]